PYASELWLMRVPAHRLLIALLLATLAAIGAGCSADDRATLSDDRAPLYVAIGASDAVGSGARDPTREGWVPQLHAKMPGGTRLANLGIGGLTIDQALEQVLPVAVDLKPTTVTVWLAVNDLAAGIPLDVYRMDLDALLGTLRQETPARVYVANLPDLTLLPAFANRDADELRVEVQRWNEAIAASAQSNDVVLVDLFTGWQELREHPEYISRDGLHPTSRGYRRLAEIFWNAMTAVQGRQAAAGAAALSHG
ncbi:MAG: SGNH/GDSL hydrolase family protein, partial [Dehalococcoidia bacterium]